MRLLVCLFVRILLATGSTLSHHSALLRKIRSPGDSLNVPATSGSAFTPFRPAQNAQPLPRDPIDGPQSQNDFHPFYPAQNSIPQNLNFPSPSIIDRTIPYPPFPQQGAGPLGTFPQQQGSKQLPIVAAIERVKSYKRMMSRAGSGQPSQGDMTNLCVNRNAEGQLQGQVGSSSSVDLSVQGWNNDGPYGFRSGSVLSQPTVFGANWAGAHYVRDC